MLGVAMRVMTFINKLNLLSLYRRQKNFYVFTKHLNTGLKAGIDA